MNNHRVSYYTTRPTNAYPKLPVHLWRKVEVVADNIIAETRREWVGSFPTRELAEGRVPAGHNVSHS